MSNKTDLQALNANYESLIEELRGKAVGGGTGSVETCTVEIISDAPMQSVTDVLYIDANSVFTIGTIIATEWMTGKSFTIAKGSIFFITTFAAGYFVIGDITKIGVGSNFILDNPDGKIYSTVVSFVANSDGSIIYG